MTLAIPSGFLLVEIRGKEYQLDIVEEALYWEEFLSTGSKSSIEIISWYRDRFYSNHQELLTFSEASNLLKALSEGNNEFKKKFATELTSYFGSPESVILSNLTEKPLES